MSASDAVVPDDARGMRSLRLMRGGEPALEAARSLLESGPPYVIATGFPVSGRPETDGPPGALALARALRVVGRVTLVSWREVLAACAPWAGEAELFEIPCGPSSGAGPRGAVIAIECCGVVGGGARVSMRGADLSADAPWFEAWLGERVSVAIGDGGNEVGMGSAPERWFEGRPVRPPISRCDVLVPACVSNWGAYAVVAEMSGLLGRDLRPRADRERALLEDLASRGFVDGFTGQPAASVDGRSWEETASVLELLRQSS